MQKVYSAPYHTPVYHAQGVLRNQGIESVVRGEHLASVVGGGAAIDAWVELWVLDESRADEARAVLEGMNEAYAGDAKPWECPKCGEKLEAQFNVCWNCGAERIGDEERFSP